MFRYVKSIFAITTTIIVTVLLSDFGFLMVQRESTAKSRGDTYSQALQVLAVETTASGRFRILFKTSTASERLESQLSSLSVETDTISVSSSETQGPDQEEARLTYRVISGLRSARDDLLTNIRLLRKRANKHETHKQRERLLELKQRIERRIARV